ncbi:MAG TPA: MFS transporter [Candidatus Sulfotelmatobacter sp.]|nr:MFS transporter [Candidatus Sulfotelmatobacter sp.]
MKASSVAMDAPAAVATPTDRPYITRIVLLFCFGWAMVYADRTVLYPLIPVVKQDLGLTAAEAGWIMGIYFLMYAPMHGVGGIIGDWLGVKRILVSFVALAGLGLLVLGVSGTYPMLLLAVAIHGLGVGCYYVGAYSITMQTVPSHVRGISSAVVNSGMSLGLVTGLVAAEPLYRAAGNWRAPFLVLAVPTLAAAAAYQLLIRPVARQGFSLRGVGAFFRDRHLMCVGLAGFAGVYAYFVILQWGPAFFQAERGFGILKSGFFTAVLALAALPAGLATGRLSDRMGRKRLSLAMFPLAALCLFLLPLVRSQAMLLLVLVLYGVVGKLAWDPVMFSWVGDRVTTVHPSTVAGCMGIFGFVIMMGAFVAPVVTGWIRDLTGSLAGGFYLAGALVLAGTFLLLVPAETVRRR